MRLNKTGTPDWVYNKLSWVWIKPLESFKKFQNKVQMDHVNL